MNWFDKWLQKKVRSVWDNHSKYEAKALKDITMNSISLVGAGQAIRGGGSDTLDSHPDLNFRMFRAENGYVMEVRQYDKRTDRHGTNLHIIPDDADLGSSIAHIITVESLKAK